MLFRILPSATARLLLAMRAIRPLYITVEKRAIASTFGTFAPSVHAKLSLFTTPALA